MWEKLAVKRKLRYYKEVINPNLEDQKYFSVVTISQKKINIAKIRMNSHELHSEQGVGLFLKLHGRKEFSICVSLWVLRMKITLLECLAYTHIGYEFHSICYNTNLYNLLTCKSYSELGKLLGKPFDGHMNKILE